MKALSAIRIAPLLALLACAAPLSAETSPRAIGPYSASVASGDLVFLSGQIAIDPATGKLDPSASIEAQTSQVWVNIRSVLQREGLDLQDVVQAQVYLTDMNDFQRMNTAYAEAIGDARPARTTVAVSALPMNANIEIAVIASRKGR